MLVIHAPCWPRHPKMVTWNQFNSLLISSQIYLVSFLLLTFFFFLNVSRLSHLCEILIPEEADRIIECKGRVFCLSDEPGVHRVWLPHEESPGLAMSRAFGDYCVKDFGLISVPEVTQRNITSRDQFVVLATDGVCIPNR